MDPLRLPSLRTVDLTVTSFNQQSSIHNHSEVITIPPFSGVPGSPYLILPSWELQGGDQSPLLPDRVGFPAWGWALGFYLLLWPILVSWSGPPVSLVRAQPSRESERRSKREPRIPSDGAPPRSSWGSSAEPPVLRLKGLAWLESHWGLQNCFRNQCSRNQAPHSESWRIQVYYAGGSRGVNNPSSEPQTQGLQSFYTWTGMVEQVCGLARARAIAKSRTKVSEISSSSQYCESPLSETYMI